MTVMEVADAATTLGDDTAPGAVLCVCVCVHACVMKSVRIHVYTDEITGLLDLLTF